MLRVLIPSTLGGAAFALAFYAWQTARADRLVERLQRRAERSTWGSR